MKDVENLIDPIIIISNNSVLLDASVEKITEKFYFEYGGQQRPDALYSEMMPGGYLNVLVNTVWVRASLTSKVFSTQCCATVQ